MRGALSFSLSFLLLAPTALAQTCQGPVFTQARKLATDVVNRFPLPGDFEEDGHPDLFVETETGFVLLANRGREASWPAKPVPARTGARAVASGDFDRDGHLDVVLQRAASVSLLLGDGSGGFRETADVTVPATSRPVTSGDLDGDGAPDLVAAVSTGGNRVLLLRGDGHGGFAPPEDLGLALSRFDFINELDAADFDRDGHPDLLVTYHLGMYGGAHYLFLGGDSGFTGPVASLLGFGGDMASIADFDEDGYPDILSALNSRFDAFLRLFVNGGNASFASFPPSVLVPSRYQGHTTADFDGDGHLDVIVGGLDALYFVKGDGKGGLAAVERLFDGERTPVAADLDADGRADLVSLDANGGFFVRYRDCAEGETRLLVPILLLNLTGANGASYTSRLTLINRGQTSAVVDGTFSLALFGEETRHGLAYLGAGEQTQQGIPLLDSGLPARSAWTLRLHGTGLSSADQLFALTNITTTTATGRGGVSFPAIPLEETLDGPAVIGWLRETEQDRTNLALVNAGEAGEVVLRVTVVSTDPAHSGSAALPDVRLAPGGFYQHDRALLKSGLGASSGFARVERVDGSARYWAWATVNDNANADGSIVPPLRAGASSSAMTLPVLVETDEFQSELIATNTSAAPMTISMRWVAEAVETGDHTARVTLELGPGEQLYAPSFVQWLRDRQVAGIGARGPIFAGALFATVDSGDPAGLFLGARTSAAGGGGRYAVFYPAVPATEAATATARVYGLEQTAETRSNLALVNAGDGPDTFRVDLFDGATGLLAASVADVTVPPRGWRQLSAILAEHAPGVSNAYARITRTAGSASFLAYAVVNQGAAPGEGSGDGSYIPMRVARDGP